ncbi:SGNH/GDSL hydrolase family protein [Faunimonas sp. B44]|uniref:SGNH/GDSL hydrolase family protein n=1 Tax=Faunimonas sp. B44 TaxID=3461493 RepID=UPI00404410CE
MDRTRHIFSALLAFILVIGLAVPAAGPALAQGNPQYVIVPAPQQERRPGIFRFLFGNRREQPPAVQAPPPGYVIRPVQPGQLQTRRPPPVKAAPKKEPVRSAKPKRQGPSPSQRTAAAPAAAPRVAATPKAEDAKKLLVIGDFMAKGLADGLEAAFAENPKIVVASASNGSSGLVRDDFYDWPAELPKIVEAEKPDAIAVMIGGNDRQTLRTEQGSLAMGSDGWPLAYGGRIDALAKSVAATGKPAFWVGLVPVRSPAMSRDYSSFNGIYREKLEPTGITFVDVWNGFADEDGKFVPSGPDVKGQTVQLRTDDGLNFTRAGQRKLAFFLERDVERVLLGSSAEVAALHPGEAAVAAIGPGEASATPETSPPAERSAPAATGAPAEPPASASAPAQAGEEAPRSVPPAKKEPVISPMASIDTVPVRVGEELSKAAPPEANRAGGLSIETIRGEGSSARPARRVDDYAWPPRR